MYYKRFFGSTLEKLVTRLKNEDIQGSGLVELNESEIEPEDSDESDLDESVLEAIKSEE